MRRDLDRLRRAVMAQNAKDADIESFVKALLAEAEDAARAVIEGRAPEPDRTFDPLVEGSVILGPTRTQIVD